MLGTFPRGPLSHSSIADLCKLVSANRPRIASEGYPVRVRDTVVAAAAELRAAGWSDTRLGRELGLSRTTMRLWLSRPAPSSFRPVTVVNEMVVPPPAPTCAPALVLVSPSGYRLEGLDIDAAAALLARLG
jgi:hypothetical protein